MCYRVVKKKVAAILKKLAAHMGQAGDRRTRMDSPVFAIIGGKKFP